MSSSLAGVQPTVPCPLNEDFQQCVRCEGSCTAPLQPLLCPMSMPCVSKCTCSFLHVRNGADGRCIPLGDCGLVGGMMGGLGGALNGAVSGAVQGYNGAAAAAIAGQNPCATMTCPAGQRCVLQQVQCVTPPCQPVPSCVA